MISNSYIPEKINEYNVYLDSTGMIGVASSHTLPEVDMQTSTVSGMGVNGEIDSPTLGQFGSMEQEIQFNTLYSSAVDMLNPLNAINFGGEQYTEFDFSPIADMSIMQESAAENVMAREGFVITENSFNYLYACVIASMTVTGRKNFLRGFPCTSF